MSNLYGSVGNGYGETHYYLKERGNSKILNVSLGQTEGPSFVLFNHHC